MKVLRDVLWSLSLEVTCFDIKILLFKENDLVYIVYFIKTEVFKTIFVIGRQ